MSRVVSYEMEEEKKVDYDEIKQTTKHEKLTSGGLFSDHDFTNIADTKQDVYGRRVLLKAVHFILLIGNNELESQRSECLK